MNWLKQYRINRLEEYIAKLEIDIDVYNNLFKNNDTTPMDIIFKYSEAKKLKAVLELRLKRLTD